MIGVADQIAKEYLNLVRFKDDFIAAQCPFHKGGQERRPSFWVSRSAGNWGCFTCSARGGSLKQLLRELGVKNLKVERDIDAAEKDAKEFAHIEKLKREKKARSTLKGTHILPDGLLGVFDWAPVPLIEAGFDEKLLEDHDIGFDRRIDRITFPVRDYEGSLVGVSGRAVKAGAIPKYLFYSGARVRDGKETKGELGEWYPTYSNEDVRNHLWRGHLVYPELINAVHEQLIIVEGFKAALWMVQCGWLNTVALMGTKMTKAQERMIRKLGQTVFVLMDNNQPGRTAAKEICQRLAVSSFQVYRCSYPEECDDDAQPDDLNEALIASVLERSDRAGGKYYVPKSRHAHHASQRQKIFKKRRR